MKPPKEGSRKASVYAVFVANGIDAAVKKAAELGLKVGTVKSWAGAWAKGNNGDEPVEKKKTKTVEKAPAKADAFDPHFRHTSKEAALKALEHLAKRNGSKPEAFHVIQQDGRYAVAPAHHKPNGPIPQFAVGDVVFDTIIPNAKGKIVEAGPEVCIVRYDRELPSRPRENAVPNVYLYKFETVEKKTDDKPIKEQRVKSAAAARKKTTKGKSK